MPRPPNTLLILLALTLLAVGCSDDGDEPGGGVANTSQANDTAGHESLSPEEVEETSHVMARLAVMDSVEVAMADAAIERTQNTRLREASEGIRQEHRTLLRRVDSLATAIGIAPELEPGLTPYEDLKRRLDELRATNPGAFERIYVQDLVTRDQEAVTLLRRYHDEVPSRHVRAYIEEILPVYERNLEFALELQNGMHGAV